MATVRSVDLRIREIGERQGGHVHHRQLAALGLSPEAIRRRIQTGRLIPVHRMVYAIGHLPLHPHDRAKGALLAAGREAALSHRSGATLWGVFSDWRFPLELSTPRDRRPSGLVIHRNTRMMREDIRVHFGVRVTSPALTVLDLAPRLGPRRLQRVIDDLRMPRPFLNLEQLEATLERFPRHPGCWRLRGVLGISEPEATRSDWEQDWRPFAERYGLPPYVTNVHVCGHRVDVFFPAQLVVVELDGWDSHRSYASFVADRDRDAELLAECGIVTVRLTRSNFRRRPRAEADRLLAILRRRWQAA